MEEKMVDVDIATYVRFCLGETSISEISDLFETLCQEEPMTCFYMPSWS